MDGLDLVSVLLIIGLLLNEWLGEDDDPPKKPTRRAKKGEPIR